MLSLIYSLEYSGYYNKNILYLVGIMTAYLKHITYLTICLLCLNSGLSLAAVYSADTHVGDGVERILVCTSQGYKWITIDTLNSNVSTDGETAFDLDSAITHHDCPFCVFNAYSIDSALDNTRLSMAFAPHFSVVGRHYLSHVSALAFYPSLHNLSRAPPSAI